MTFFVSIIILLLFNFLIKNFIKNNFMQNDKKINIENYFPENIIQQNNIEMENEIKININNDINFENSNWYIEIPLIKLRAPINESTNMEVLNNFVGHFTNTPKTEGNIGLAGHNRGYAKNFFQDLNKLKIGDEIKYKYNDFEKIYLIEKIEIIKNTNWSYLESTKENKITLITCVENKPDLRLCIQAVEK